ncbi:MAG: hypothetical protein AAGF24_06835 [Cyanobacteria bacterium P01_H01_bin.121]
MQVKQFRAIETTGEKTRVEDWIGEALESGYPVSGLNRSRKRRALPGSYDDINRPRVSRNRSHYRSQRKRGLYAA